MNKFNIKNIFLKNEQVFVTSICTSQLKPMLVELTPDAKHKAGFLPKVKINKKPTENTNKVKHIRYFLQ